MSQSSDWVTASDEQEAKELAVQVNNMGLQQPEGNDGEAPLSAADKSLMAKAARERLYESTREVEVLRKDPNSPLYSVKTFQELHLRPELLQRLAELNFTYPSKIQETTLPTLLASPPTNLIAQSQSGTGKTAAFCLGMLSRIDPSQNCVQAICLSPTFELANQTTAFIKDLGKLCTDINIRSAVKGDFVPRGSKVTDHIIIGTPGKVVDWATKLKVLDLSQCKVFALDEADVMISQQGHQDQSVRIHKLLPSDCQMMLFSATYDDSVIMFAEAIIHNPVVLRLRKEEETLDNIKQLNVECQTAEEKYRIISLITSLPNGKLMFFCRTKATGLWLSKKLTEEGHNVAFLSGDLTSQERVDVLKGYREAAQRALVCTNVVSRGIDIEGVTLVVNFDLPDTQEGDADCETYLHRIGRTGRFGKTGVAVNLIDGPRSRSLMDQIENHFKIKIETVVDHGEILKECERFKD